MESSATLTASACVYLCACSCILNNTVLALDEMPCVAQNRKDC